MSYELLNLYLYPSIYLYSNIRLVILQWNLQTIIILFYNRHIAIML